MLFHPIHSHWTPKQRFVHIFVLQAELYIVHKVQIKISSLRWSEKKVQIKVHAWTWTWAFILSSHKLTVLNVHQWSDVSLRSKLKFKFRHELWSELFLKLTQRPDLICELKIRSDLLYNSGLAGVWQKNSQQKSVWDYVYDTKHGCNFLWKSGSMTQNVWHKKGDLE